MMRGSDGGFEEGEIDGNVKDQLNYGEKSSTNSQSMDRDRTRSSTQDSHPTENIEPKHPQRSSQEMTQTLTNNSRPTDQSQDQDQEQYSQRERGDQNDSSPSFFIDLDPLPNLNLKRSEANDESVEDDDKVFDQPSSTYEYEPILKNSIIGLDEPSSSSNQQHPLTVRRCFNCGDHNHSVNNCSEPRNESLIRLSKQIFQSIRTESSDHLDETGNERSISMLGFSNNNSNNNGEFEQNSFKRRKLLSSKFYPGRYSETLREAVFWDSRSSGPDPSYLDENRPMPWFQSMERWGYPPGYTIDSEGIELDPFESIKRRIESSQIDSQWESTEILKMHKGRRRRKRRGRKDLKENSTDEEELNHSGDSERSGDDSDQYSGEFSEEDGDSDENNDSDEEVLRLLLPNPPLPPDPSPNPPTNDDHDDRFPRDLDQLPPLPNPIDPSSSSSIDAATVKDSTMTRRLVRFRVGNFDSDRIPIYNGKPISFGDLSSYYNSPYPQHYHQYQQHQSVNYNYYDYYQPNGQQQPQNNYYDPSYCYNSYHQTSYGNSPSTNGYGSLAYDFNQPQQPQPQPQSQEYLNISGKRVHGETDGCEESNRKASIKLPQKKKNNNNKKQKNKRFVGFQGFSKRYVDPDDPFNKGKEVVRRIGGDENGLNYDEGLNYEEDGEEDEEEEVESSDDEKFEFNGRKKIRYGSEDGEGQEGYRDDGGDRESSKKVQDYRPSSSLRSDDTNKHHTRRKVKYEEEEEDVRGNSSKKESSDPSFNNLRGNYSRQTMNSCKVSNEQPTIPTVTTQYQSMPSYQYDKDYYNYYYNNNNNHKSDDLRSYLNYNDPSQDRFTRSIGSSESDRKTFTGSQALDHSSGRFEFCGSTDSDRMIFRPPLPVEEPPVVPDPPIEGLDDMVISDDD